MRERGQYAYKPISFSDSFQMGLKYPGPNSKMKHFLDVFLVTEPGGANEVKLLDPEKRDRNCRDVT